jgi:hypothetical protein
MTFMTCALETMLEDADLLNGDLSLKLETENLPNKPLKTLLLDLLNMPLFAK